MATSEVKLLELVQVLIALEEMEMGVLEVVTDDTEEVNTWEELTGSSCSTFGTKVMLVLFPVKVDTPELINEDVNDDMKGIIADVVGETL